MMRVKLCGMATLDDVAVCVEAGADALGFIFADSPRRLTVALDLAPSLTRAVPPFVTTVGVFANNPAQMIREAIAQCRLDVLQFAGDETPEFCGSFGKPTILVARDRSLTPAQRATAHAGAILVDSWSPREYGGTGRVVDSLEFARVRGESPGACIILAGGLSPRNVTAMIRASHPDAVDARTGVERDGKKDPALTRAFVRAARAALGMD
jgi:phosphoribosylanthranilate isomerase